MKNLNNPFNPKYSAYSIYKDGKLLSPNNNPLTAFQIESHDRLRDLVLDPEFACVAAQAAIKSGKYVFAAYEGMTSPEVAEGLCYDLLEFIYAFDLANLVKLQRTIFATFIAAFESQPIEDEIQAVEPFDTLLLNMHNADKKYFSWANDVSDDIESNNFSFSIAENAFFVPFFHPFTSSKSRQTKDGQVFVVFNSHAIFEVLRMKGAFEPLKNIIRGRQKWVHPHIADHGEMSEFRQYGLVSPDEDSQLKAQKAHEKVLGKCPFRK